MKTFTDKETKAIAEYICNVFFVKVDEANDHAKAISFQVDQAEGYPVPNESKDIYIAAKGKIKDAIEELNDQVRLAKDIGLNVNIEVIRTGHVTPAAMPAPVMPAPVYQPMTPNTWVDKPIESVIFKLGKLYKEF